MFNEQQNQIDRLDTSKATTHCPRKSSLLQSNWSFNMSLSKAVLANCISAREKTEWKKLHWNQCNRNTFDNFSLQWIIHEKYEEQKEEDVFKTKNYRSIVLKSQSCWSIPILRGNIPSKNKLNPPNNPSLTDSSHPRLSINHGHNEHNDRVLEPRNCINITGIESKPATMLLITFLAIVGSMRRRERRRFKIDRRRLKMRIDWEKRLWNRNCNCNLIFGL